MNQGTLRFEFLPSYREEDFLVAPANEEAYRWVTGWPEAWPGCVLNLYGPRASGKTHLAHLWQRRSDAAWLAPEWEVDAPASRCLEGARAWIAQEPAPQEDETHWFHLLNAVQQEKKYLLITSREPLSRLAPSLPDLASRLAALPAVGIGRPDDALLEALLYKRFSDLQLKVSPEVVPYLLGRAERSFAAADALIRKLEARSLMEKKNITLALARKILEIK